jgi:hypothetical protein
MEAVAHNPAFAKKAGVPQSVGKEFSKADKALKLRPSVRTRADRQVINKPKTDHGAAALFKEGGTMKESKAMMAKEVSFMKKAGAPKSMVKHEMAEAKMAKGGIATSLKAHAAAPASKAHSGMKSGGFTRAADGVATKGKTKGTQIKMASGGKTC